MQFNKLSKEATALIYHVELNQTDWLKKAYQNLIIAVLVENKNAPMTKEEIRERLVAELDEQTVKFRYNGDLDILVSKKALLIDKNSLPNKYLLADEKYEDFRQDAEKQELSQVESKGKFIELCKVYSYKDDSEKLWDNFNNNLVIPIVKNMGARALELMTSKQITVDNPNFSSFLSNYNDSSSQVIQKVANDFFDFNDPNIKRFILSTLNSYFFVIGSGLDKKCIDTIEKTTKGQKKLTLFVDTNFLLSLLLLHDNPSNDAIQALKELLILIKNKVSVKFKVLSITKDEFTNLIERNKKDIEKMNLNLNKIKAIINAPDNANISGITKRYAVVCEEKGTVMNTDLYFNKYIENTTVTFRNYGVEIHNNDYSYYRQKQEVIDNIVQQKEFWENKIEQNKELSAENKFHKKDRLYHILEHDCAIWEIVKDIRPYTDDIKSIEQWIITLDYKLLSFDRHMERSKGASFGICLHPNDLISMLQFWMPRSENLERAIFENFKLPFLVGDFDSEAESISKRILDAMATYEDDSDLEEETITELLTNNTLRNRIKKASSVEEDANLLREAIFMKLEEAKANERQKAIELEEEKSKNKTLHENVESISKTVQDQHQKIEQNSIQIKNMYNDAIRNSLLLSIENNKKYLESAKKELEKEILKKEGELKDFNNKVLVEIATKKVKKGFFNSIWYGDVDAKNDQIEKEIKEKTFKSEEYILLCQQVKELKEEVETIDSRLKEWDGSGVFVYCENTNALHFNKLEISNIHFHGTGNSQDIFEKSVQYPHKFSLRDRDLLSDEEIRKIQRKYPNYLTTKYYCFENYLYHPENIRELIDKGLISMDISAYKSNILKQKNDNKESMKAGLKNIRKEYSEFKQPQLKFQDKDNLLIESYLDSDDFEIFLKSYSLKGSQYFKKDFLASYNLNEKLLTSTEWFKQQIQELLKPKTS